MKTETKRLITICAVLILSSTCVSLAVPTAVSGTGPAVIAPPDAPGWWNADETTLPGCEYYAYGYWEDDLYPADINVSPPNDVDHWASNFLVNTDFKASVDGNTITLDLTNEFREDYYKEIYIYLNGTTDAGPGNSISGDPNTDGGTFSGEGTFGIGGGEWHYKLIGEIHPQPDWVKLTVTVPGLIDVANIWAGENCLPEPATIALLGLGALSLLRRRRA